MTRKTKGKRKATIWNCFYRTLISLDYVKVK